MKKIILNLFNTSCNLDCNKILINKREDNKKTSKAFVKTLFLSVILFLFGIVNSKAQTTVGPNNTGTGANVTGVGTVAWANPTRIYTSDDSRATIAGLASSAISNYLRASNFGFSIPANATILGVTVNIERESSGNSIRDNVVSLVNGAGTVVGNNKAVTSTNWPTTEDVATYGGAADNWNASLTAADINNSNFGVALAVRNIHASNARTPRVDHITISVTYSTPPANDVCSSATSLPCETSNLAGTTVNSVAETAPGICVGTNGVWYSFAGDGKYTTISAFSSMDIGIYIASGTCAARTQLQCIDGFFGNATETSTNFLTLVGTTYYVYIANFEGSTTGNFTISRTCPSPSITTSVSSLTAFSACANTASSQQSFTVSGSNLTANLVVTPPTGFEISSTSGSGFGTSAINLAPSSGSVASTTIYVRMASQASSPSNGNIACSSTGATVRNVAVSGTIVNTAATTTTGLSSSITTTSATLAGSYVANCQTITAYGIEYSTTNNFANGSGTQVSSSNQSSGSFTSSVSGLSPSTTYYYKSYATNSSGATVYGSQSSFTTLVAPPSNDDCSNAIPLTINTSCSYTTYTNANATASSGVTAPGCAAYSGGDVWFSFVVPANGRVTVDSQAGVMTDSGMAWYTGTCGSLTVLECDDDSIGTMSSITRTGLTPGTTIYVRFWEYGNNNNGTFGICATSPAPITITPATTITFCSVGSVQLTASSTAAYTYTWSPSTGLNTTTGATVTANPSTTTTYTVTGTQGATTSTNTITITVNPAQPDLVITTSDATVCKNTVQELTATGGTLTGATVTASSGTVNLTIPDGNLTTGASQNLTVNGIPANVTITKVDVLLNITHTWLSDLRINLEAPNGQIINLINQRGGDSDNFTNTIVTSNTGAASLSTGSAPFTGTFTADIANQATIGTTPAVTTTTFSNLFATPNGTWKVRVYDDESIASGTLNNCSITITYDGGVITWSPTTDLYTNETCTTAYTGGHATNLWSKPTATRTYTATSTLGSCEKTDTVTLTVESATYNGSWSSAPAANKELVFNGNFSSTESLEGCSCTITSGNVIINSNHTVKLLDAITVNGGSITFENNSSLIQINDVANTGNITYKRTSPQSVLNTDYVYWSAPVSNQNVPSTGLNYFWNNAAGTSGNWVSASNQPLDAGKGVIMRGIASRNFTGIPFNGEITVNVHRRNLPDWNDNWNLIGNPYPSAISADEFLLDPNNSAIEGSVAIWTHGTPLSSSNDQPFYGNFTYNYTPNDYIIYNALAAQSGLGTYQGLIPAGQAFFVKYNNDDNASPTAASSTIKFKNSMRLDESGNAYNNTQFFRNTGNVSQNIEKSRIWIDIVNGANAFHRTVVGYIESATDGKDRLFDAATSVTPSSTSIYSLIGNDKMCIQGKGLPFNNSDIIPLGFNAAQAGNYTIAIHALDGLFVNQDVYLLDTQASATHGVIHNIKLTPYTFTATQGVNNTRFRLIFNNGTLSNPDFDAEKSVIIVNKDKLEVISNVEEMESIVVFDLLGRTIYMNNTINSREFVIPISQERAPLIVKIKLANGIYVERKTLY